MKAAFLAFLFVIACAANEAGVGQVFLPAIVDSAIDWEPWQTSMSAPQDVRLESLTYGEEPPWRCAQAGKVICDSVW